MKSKNKMVSVFLAGALAGGALLPASASAAGVNASVAASSSETLAAINAMNLVALSDQVAMDVRGGQLTLDTPYPVNGSALARLRYYACINALRTSGRILPMCVGLY